MTSFHSNPQVPWSEPAAHNPLRTQPYYSVHPVPFPVTAERAAAGMDRIRHLADGQWMIPPHRDVEQRILDDARTEEETPMETFAKVMREQAKGMDREYNQDWKARSRRDRMRDHPELYEEFAPGRFTVADKPGAFDIFDSLGPEERKAGQIPEELKVKVTVDPGPRSLVPLATLDPLDDQAYIFPDGEYNTGRIVKDGMVLALMAFGYWGQRRQSINRRFWPFFYTVIAALRYVSFYRDFDAKASVGAAAYWGTSYYLYGPRYMSLTMLFDYAAGRTYIASKQ